MNKVLLDQACKVVSDVLKIDESTIPHDASIRNFSGWDSFAQVELMFYSFFVNKQSNTNSILNQN